MLQDGYTPCHVACLNDHAEVLELLIHIKADLALKSKVRTIEAFKKPLLVSNYHLIKKDDNDAHYWYRRHW